MSESTITPLAGLTSAMAYLNETHLNGSTVNGSIGNLTTTMESLPDWYDEYLYWGKLYTFILKKVYYYGIFTIFGVGLVTNFLVIVTMIANRKLRRNSAGALMLALAIDEFVVMVPGIILQIDKNHGIIGKPYCKGLWYFVNFLANISRLLVVLMSVNRYALVCWPFTHHKITSMKSTLLQVSMVIILCASSSVYQFFFWSPKSDLCDNIDDKQVFPYLVTYIVYSVVFSIIPIFVTGILTILVVKTLLKKQGTLGESSNKQGTMTAGERNITKALIAVNIAFIIFFLPFYVTYFVYLGFFLVPKVDIVTAYKVLVVNSILALIEGNNYIVNLFIYTWYSPTFRDSLVKVLCLRCKNIEEDTKIKGSVKPKAETK